jgi:hypothetical protein
MKGYRNEPEKTAEAVDADGWLHTGDVGSIYADGYIRIIDRKKELIINSAGKNMSPIAIESAIKGASSLIGQAVAIGDGRPYNVALIALDPDVAAGRAHDDPDVVREIGDAIARGGSPRRTIKRCSRHLGARRPVSHADLQAQTQTHRGALRRRDRGALRAGSAVSDGVHLVTGAAGFLGRHLVAQLAASGVAVRAAALPREDASALVALGVEVARADLTAPETLPPLFAGVTRVFHLGAICNLSTPTAVATVNVGHKRITALRSRPASARSCYEFDQRTGRPRRALRRGRTARAGTTTAQQARRRTSSGGASTRAPRGAAPLQCRPAADGAGKRSRADVIGRPGRPGSGSPTCASRTSPAQRCTWPRAKTRSDAPSTWPTTATRASRKRSHSRRRRSRRRRRASTFRFAWWPWRPACRVCRRGSPI